MLCRRRWRKLVALLTYLPSESATVTLLTGVAPGERWGPSEYLLAMVVDSIQTGNWQRYRAAGGKGGSRPRPVPRPGERAPTVLKGDSMAPADLRAELQARQRKGGG